MREVLARLEKMGNAKTRDGMARYGIVAPKAFGVPVGAIQKMGKSIGHDHALAEALWKSGWYEARMLCSWVDDPALVTSAQMDRWAKDFDNWGIVDTVCFHLFDRTPLGWKKIAPWSRSKHEFTKRAAFALLAGLALHDKEAEDAQFLRVLPLVERAATDERNFVKKGVSWGLRVVGRRNAKLHAACVATAKRLTASNSASAQWIGRGALREFGGAVVKRKLAAKKPG